MVFGVLKAVLSHPQSASPIFRGALVGWSGFDVVAEAPYHGLPLHCRRRVRVHLPCARRRCRVGRMHLEKPAFTEGLRNWEEEESPGRGRCGRSSALAVARTCLVPGWCSSGEESNRTRTSGCTRTASTSTGCLNGGRSLLCYELCATNKKRLEATDVGTCLRSDILLRFQFLGECL